MTQISSTGERSAARQALSAVIQRGLRVARIAAALALSLVAAAIVVTLTIDLGPAVRARAEQEGSARLGRPLHIGGLSIHLGRGAFVIDNLVIEGLTPEDPPFLRADQVVVSMPWWTIFRREVLFESVEMSDWEMVIEAYPDGRNNLPVLRLGDGPRGQQRFTTTLSRVHARRGQFTYDDHGTPWSAVASNLDVVVTKTDEYRGVATFSGGTVQILSYEPMWADMRAEFTVEGREVVLHHIDLKTDGAESVATGSVDLARWPEQSYHVRSWVQFPRMRELFFAGEDFSLSGEGEFEGVFHLYSGGRELNGTFTSGIAGVDDYRFPDLRGALRWTPDRLEVFDASSRFSGGNAHFAFSMGPFGAAVPAEARFDVRYEGVNLAELSDFFETRGIRLAGRATGRNRLQWPLGSFSEHHGDGAVAIQPPAGVAIQTPQLPQGFMSDEERWGREFGPFDPDPRLGYLPIGGSIVYAYGPEWVDLRPSWLATPKTHVGFEGRTAYGERSRIPFHVTSADWQESNRVLAGVLTAFGSPTSAIEIGGYGEFTGVMLNSFQRPRIEGTFAGERMRAWDVVWGSGRAQVIVENSYAQVSEAIVRWEGSEIHAAGRFSLGYPRRDGGDEIDTSFRLVRRPVADLRHAFELDDYPVDGELSGDFHVYGHYTRPYGFGRMTIDRGVAYGETFATATAGLRFEGDGARLDALEIAKDSGTVTGAARVGWNGTYSFNAVGRRIPMESVDLVAYERTPFSGLLEFTASGSGTFDVPQYDVQGRIADLFVADEGVGQVTGRLGVRGEQLTLDVEAASPRLAVSGSGRIALTEEADAELTFRFADTSLDPYMRAFEPRMSPFTTAVGSGALRVAGKLSDPWQLVVETTLDQLNLTLFDYRLANDGPIHLALSGETVHVRRMRLAGDGTQLELAGEIAIGADQFALHARGDANLGILQGLFRDLRSSGAAEVVADIHGRLQAPQLSGTAFITNGRIRHFELPHSLESINGRLSFDGSGIRLDDLAGRLGGGEVQFGGRVALAGFMPAEVNLTARGEGLRLRYPEGVRSVIDADLALRGPFESPLLSGTVEVRSAVWTRRFDPAGFDLTGARAGSAPPAPAETTLPLRYDIRVLAPSTLRIENNTARIVSSADLALGGSYDRPVLFGRVQIERGEVIFEGNRYLVRRGSIDFVNPARIEPFFDVEAETQVRVPGQTYRIVFHATGTLDRFVPELMSDPPLPTVDILGLLFGDLRDPQDAEIRALRTPEATEQELVRSRAARLLASPLSSGVGRVVEETFGVDTVQITPSLGDPLAQQQAARLNPSARLTIGKRISDRIYLTFSRPITSATPDQILLLEYAQTDRLAWVLTQNEDRSYSLDFRVRHSF